ncbi:TolC family protein [Aquabacterium sp.]|uniref:TolC family protein n=1 Tax=Aquabacterium sp. TaxID=1872578 RepID=UPI0035B45EE3
MLNQAAFAPARRPRSWGPTYLMTWVLTAMAPLAAAAQIASSQTAAAPAGPQTLAQALDAAWALTPTAAATPNRQAQAQAELDGARALTPGPAALSVSHLSDRLNSNLGRREWEVEVATPLWLPGQQAARQALAQRTAEALDAHTAAQRLQLAADVREAWWAVASTRAAAELARQRLASAEQLEQAVQRRYKTGDLARLDANLAQTERLQAAADALDAERAEQQARQAYQTLVGAPPPGALPPETQMADDDPSTTALPIVPSPHPQLRALQASIDVARSQLAWVDANRRDAPELALRWNNQRGDAITPYDQGVGVKLTIPLSSDARTRQSGAAARAELAQAEAEWAAAQRRTEQDAARAQTDWQAARRQVELARERSRATADNLDLAQRAFGLGEVDLPTLLRARTAAQEAAVWLQRQEIGRDQALSRLHQAQGRLP